MRAFDAAWLFLKALPGDRMIQPNADDYFSHEQTAHPAIIGLMNRLNAERSVNPITPELMGRHDTAHRGPKTPVGLPFINDPHRFSHDMRGKNSIQPEQGNIGFLRPSNQHEEGTPHEALQQAMHFSTVPVSTGRGVMNPPYITRRTLHPEEVAVAGYAAEDVPVSMRETIGTDIPSSRFRDLMRA